MEGKIRVVVADDQNISRAFFEMYVRADARYQLLAALRTAQEAVDYVDVHPTDLLILDVMMLNGMDGLTAAGEIKDYPDHVCIGDGLGRTGEKAWRGELLVQGV